MHMGIRQSGTGKSLFAMVLFLSLFLSLGLRAFIPAGYMPAAASDGLVIQLCSDMAGGQIVVDLDRAPDRKAPAQSPADAEKPCLFALAHAHALPMGDVAPALRPLLLALLLFIGQAMAVPAILPLQAPPPPSQGPPTGR